MTSASFPAIEAKNVSKYFEAEPAVDGVSFTVNRGEQAVFLGPSGAGKTTLLHMIGGLTNPDNGVLSLEGQDITEISDPSQRSSLVGIMHQHFDLVEPLPVLHNVLAGELGRWNFWQSFSTLLWPSTKQCERAYNALQRVGIPGKMYDKTAHLSGGEQQRVALARLLVQKPKIILADEPVASVDPARARSLLNMLLNIADEDDLTLIASLHDVSYAREFFPRLVGLRRGRMFFDHAAEQIEHDQLDQLYSLDSSSEEAA